MAIKNYPFSEEEIFDSFLDEEMMTPEAEAGIDEELYRREFENPEHLKNLLQQVKTPQPEVVPPVETEAPMAAPRLADMDMSRSLAQAQLSDMQKKQEADKRNRWLTVMQALNEAGQGFSRAGALAAGKDIGTMKSPALAQAFKAAQEKYSPEEDPTSQISQFYRTFAKSRYPEMDITDEMSAKQIKELGLNVQKQMGMSDLDRARLEKIKKQTGQIGKPKDLSELEKARAAYLRKQIEVMQDPKKLSELEKARASYYQTRADLMPKQFQLALEKEVRQEGAEKRRVKALDFKISDDAEKDRTNSQKQVRQDIRWKASQEIRMAMDKVKDTLERAERGDETALATLGVQVAKAMGEKGMLSETDVRRYIEASSTLGNVHARVMRMAQGKPTPAVAKSIRGLLTDMDMHLGKELETVFDEQAKWYMKAQEAQGRDVNYDKARWVVDPNYFNPEDKKIDKTIPKNEVRRRTKDGKIAIFDADTKEFLRYEGE